MDIYTIAFWLLEVCIFLKNLGKSIIDFILSIGPIAQAWYYMKSVFIHLHNEFYHIRCEPFQIPWISITSVESKSYFELDADYHPIDDTVYHKYVMNETYFHKPLNLFGFDSYQEIPDANTYVFPHPNDISMTDYDPIPYRDVYNTSILNLALFYVTYKTESYMPVLYMLKTTDQTINDYTKSPLEFQSYMIVHLESDEDIPDQERMDRNIQKLLSTVQHRKPSNVRFLSIEYVHPDMDRHISLDIPENMFYVGNELLSSTFILRFLEYVLGKNNFSFDDRYKILIMTKNIDFIELTFDKYLLLDSEETYRIMRFENVPPPLIGPDE
jgi:hypothetical protein